MKILYLTTVLPVKRSTGGEIATMGFIDALISGGNEVHMVGYQRKGDQISKNQGIISVGTRHIETTRARYYPLVWMLSGLLRGIPYSSAKYYSKKYFNKVIKLTSDPLYDLVVLDHSQLGWLTDYINKDKTFIFVAHNVEFEVYSELRDKTGNPLIKSIYNRESCLMKSLETKIVNKAAAVWALTRHDAECFSEIAKGTDVTTFDIPSSLLTLREGPSKKDYDVALIGSWTWKSNIKGLRWFFDNVFPHLDPNLDIRVAGRGADWLGGKYPNVKYVGFVPDAREFMSKARVVAIPSIEGGGVQIKTLDAITSGSLIVATPFALRGIDDFPSTIRAAEKPNDFAQQIMAQLSAVDYAPEESRKAFAWTRRRKQAFTQKVATEIEKLRDKTVRNSPVSRTKLC